MRRPTPSRLQARCLRNDMEEHTEKSREAYPRRALHIEALLAPGAVAFELHDGASPDHLSAIERRSILRAANTRQREFAAGRLCARAGLLALGFDAVAVPSRHDRVPEWPPGAVGSITHTTDYCLAVTGLRADFAAIGVDAERIGAVDPETWRLVMRGEEQRAVIDMDDASRRIAATVIFSAKEAFYKCQYALTRRWLGFEDAVVTVGNGAFSIEVIDSSHPALRLARSCSGRFHVVEPLVITVMALSADTVSRADDAAASSGASASDATRC